MLEFAIQWIKDNYKREEGQAMAEYGIILALIAAICITAIGFLGKDILNTLNSLVGQL